MKVIVSYEKPDMDGVACMYAYSELLNRQNDPVNYFIWGIPKQEVEIVCEMFGIKLKGLEENEISEEDEFIVVDLNNFEQMHSKVNKRNIIEIIDHHGLSKYLSNYENIKRTQIDRIGAAATIVAERYKNSGLLPSREAAILLYYGIISNSINLKASITNQRDIEACEWLKSICSDISEEKIKEIFIKKSYIEDKNLRTEMECEIPNVFDSCKVIVAQLEVANAEEFLNNKKQIIIEIMKNIKSEKNADFVFLNCVDILNDYIIVFVADEESKEFVSKIFNYDFDKNNMAKINRIIQRKNMTQILREKLN